MPMKITTSFSNLPKYHLEATITKRRVYLHQHKAIMNTYQEFYVGKIHGLNCQCLLPHLMGSCTFYQLIR